MARATYVKAARKEVKDYDGKVIVKVGQPYYWWKFRFGGKHYSLTPPKRSQLTQSGFKSSLYDIEDQIAELTADSPEDLESALEDIKSELDSLKEECSDSLANMPEHLQESSSSGEMLTERVDALENAISELDYIDLSYDEPDDEVVKERLDAEASEEDIEAEKEVMLQEWLDEKICEIQDVAIEC